MALAWKKVPFQVCEQSEAWTRPSEEVQAKIWNYPTYKNDYGSLKSEAWTRLFFRRTLGGTGYHLRNLTGIWTATDVRQLCDNRERLRQLGRLEKLEVWVLLHKVKAIECEEAVCRVTVEPTGKGFQMVQFPMPPAMRWTRLTHVFVFVTPEGQEVGRIEG